MVDAHSNPTAERTGPIEGVRRTHGASIPRGATLAGALCLGIAGDLLLRPDGGPGLNLFLLFVGLAVVVEGVSRRAGLRPSLEARLWMGAGVLFTTAFVLRASSALQVLAFLTAATAFALPALRSGASWLRGSGVTDPIEAIGGAILHSALGPLRWLLEGSRAEAVSPGPLHARMPRSGATARPPAAPAEGDPIGVTPAGPVLLGGALLRGLLLAIPFLLLFGALFMSADRVFAEIVTGLIPEANLERFLSHLFLIGLLTWLASGYLSGFVVGTRVRDRLAPLWSRPSLGIVETGTALALVDLLFAVFVLVQLRYLFGGSALVEVTPGLTYAEYAREGFAQIVVAAGLVLPLLLGCEWLLRRVRPRDERVFRGLGGIQLFLLAVVIASALQRVRVYQEAYGLTESRFYGAAFLVWLLVLSGWFAATILRGRRDRFAPVALVSGVVLVGILLLLNPDERIARANLEHGGEVDVEYLASLSADAVPFLLETLPGLAPELRCTLEAELRRRWVPDGPGDWRNWNRAEVRARGRVREGLAGFLPAGRCPEPVAREGSPESAGAETVLASPRSPEHLGVSWGP